MCFFSPSSLRRLGLSLALAPAAVTVVVPLWLLSAALDGWREPIDALHHHKPVIIVGVWTVAISIIAIKFILPLLASQAEPRTTIGPLLPLVWLAAVAASAAVVVVGGHNSVLPSADLGRPDLVAAVVIWLCVEIIGTTALPALLKYGAEKTMRVASNTALAPTATDQAPSHSKKPRRVSASSAMTAEQILEGLRDLAASRWGSYPLSIRMLPDGWIQASHRALAEAFDIPRTNLVRRLDQLTRDGKIQVISKQELGTLIKVLNDTAQH